MKKFLRYLRHRICRAIYYADFKPANSKDWGKIFSNSICGLAVIAALLMWAAFLLLHF